MLTMTSVIRFAAGVPGQRLPPAPQVPQVRVTDSRHSTRLNHTADPGEDVNLAPSLLLGTTDFSAGYSRSDLARTLRERLRGQVANLRAAAEVGDVSFGRAPRVGPHVGGAATAAFDRRTLGQRRARRKRSGPRVGRSIEP